MPSRKCPYCLTQSNFNFGQGYGSKQKANHILSIDECQNCSNYVLFEVTDNTRVTVSDMYPKVEGEIDEELPEEVRIPFDEAARSLMNGIWNGCVTMCRRALAECMVKLGAGGSTLYDQINDAVAKGLLTATLGEWGHEGRLAGNLGAHGTPQKQWADETDAKEIFEFCTWVFRYIYVLPKQLEERRNRLQAP